MGNLGGFSYLKERLLKECSKCLLVKPLVDFRERRNECKTCCAAMCRTYRKDNLEKIKASEKRYVSANPEAIKAAKHKYYNSPHGKAQEVLGAMRRRSKKEGWPIPEFTQAAVALAIVGACAVTGIPFNITNTTPYRHNPYAPSPDRIDSNLGYTKDNVQWVIWTVNRMKAEVSQELFEEIVVAISTKGASKTSLTQTERNHPLLGHQ